MSSDLATVVPKREASFAYGINRNHVGSVNLATFDSAFEPTIAIQAYIQRLSKYLKCSFEAYCVAFCLLERIEIIANVPITRFNVHRLMLISTRVATKFLDDKHYKNDYFAKVGGIPLDEFNHLERSFVTAIGYRLHVNETDFKRMHARLWRGNVWRPLSISSPASPAKRMKMTSLRTRDDIVITSDESKACEQLAATANSVVSAIFDFDA